MDEWAALDAFGECWDKKYPKIVRSWRKNRANLYHQRRCLIYLPDM